MKQLFHNINNSGHYVNNIRVIRGGGGVLTKAHIGGPGGGGTYEHACYITYDSSLRQLPAVHCMA